MSKKHISLLACLIMLPFLIFGQTVNVVTDRPDATYEAGESMNFIVTGGSGSANYVIHYDHGVTPALARGTIQLGGTVEIPFTLDEPGAVICLVVATDGLDVIGATFSPFEIEPYEDDPADYDAFWDEMKSQLAAVPLDPQLTSITTNNANTDDFRISLGSVEGRRLYGYVSIPKGGTNLPAVITHSAFGIGPNLCVPRPEIADELGAISMSIWMHDGEPDTQVTDAYEPMAWDDRDQIYFRYGVLGMLRAMDYIEIMPEFRGQGIILNGVSEGGGMSLMTAGIDDRVTGVSASIFAHAEHTGFNYGKASGFPHYLQQAPFVIQGVDVDKVLEATKYYDVVRAAKRFDGPVLASIGYEDLTSIPMAQFGAYNQLKGPKTLIHKTAGAHQNPDEFFIGKFDFYRKWLNLPGQTNYHANAGADETVSSSATLTGVVERLGMEDTSLPVEWTMVSGPSPANISSPNSRTTTVNFTEDGEYEFRIRATDQTDLTATNTFYTFSDVVKITVNNGVVDPCANAGGDADGDGVCATEDCDDNNPNISRQGDACDDGNANTTDDVIQADCSCLGTTLPPADPCANSGGDADGDGVCANEDCNDNNPNISRPSDACDDGNANTTDDVIQADCSCVGTMLPPVDPCATAGGDTDGDGVCANEDCNDNNPNISRPGDACDDGNANTTNDVIQADCSCLGTSTPPPTSGNCRSTYQLNGNVVSVSSLDYTHNLVNIYDDNFTIIESCQDWDVVCNTSEDFVLPTTGLYFIQIQTFADWNNQVCNIFEAIEVNMIPGCENVTDGGLISGDETICNTEIPNPITSDAFPTGGAGTMEYQWISSTAFCPYNIGDAIPGANQSTYTPGLLTETTYFRRLSRRAGCTDWDMGVSNCVAKVVENCSTPPSGGCNVNYEIDGNIFRFSNVTTPIAAVKITDNNGVLVYGCESPFGTPCPEMAEIQLQPGSYFLTLATAENWIQGFICDINETIEVNSTFSRQSGKSDAFKKDPVAINNLNDKLIIYPNPAKDEINLKLGNGTLSGSAIIFNQFGQIVKRAFITDNPISVAELPSGVYFVRVGKESIRFLKTK